MATNENIESVYDGDFMIGNGFYSSGANLTATLTSNTFYSLYQITNLPLGTYLVGMDFRIACQNANTNFTSIQMNIANPSGVESNQTSLFQYPKVFQQNQPIKRQFTEIIRVTNDVNSCQIGLTAIFNNGGYQLTDWFLNVNKIA